MSTNNICKFISEINEDNIYTKNFVFEKSGKTFENTFPENNSIYLVINGKGNLTINGFSYKLTSGKIFYTFQKIPYTIESTDSLKYMYVTFNGKRSDELFTRFGVSVKNCVFDGHEGIISFWQNAIIKAGERNLDLISEAVLLYTLGEMAPSNPSDESLLINSITKIIDDNYTDVELNLQTVADKLGYNSKYISRVFKDNMGVTFSSYLKNVRIQNAVFLIEQGVTAIKNVALLSGYKDPFYFSSVFKSVTGKSPKQYIEDSKKA
jgi:two-component system response regulator YesN